MLFEFRLVLMGIGKLISSHGTVDGSEVALTGADSGQQVEGTRYSRGATWVSCW